MNSSFSDTEFSIELTEDGSPTLRLPSDGESMHHMGGAATETRYIYKSVIEAALAQKNEVRVAVVGLGLGYIEISWAAAVLQRQTQAGSDCVSYEIDEGLKNKFQSWVNAEAGANNLYDQVCHHMAPDLSTTQIKNLLFKNFKKNPIRGDLLKAKCENFNVICFDAFSSKTNSPLWTYEFLNDFIKKACAPDAVFTTYACTANLKKALSANGFTLVPRSGFKGKRESTLACRGAIRF